MSNTNRALYPGIFLRVSQYELRQFEKLKTDHNMSIREVLENACCPCPHCKNPTIVAYDRDSGEPIEIPRGIIAKKERT